MKKIAVIQDLSGLGRCSLTAAIPVISAMGIQACPLPTAILSNQTGYQSYFYDDYTERMEQFSIEWKRCGFVPDGIYVGFLANETQVEKILGFVDDFGQEETTVVVDAVLGDQGLAYPFYREDFCDKIRSLVACAHVITPNLTECLLLLYGKKKMREVYEGLMQCEGSEDYCDRIACYAKELRCKYGLRAVVVTGIDLHKGSEIANLVVTEGGCDWVISKKYGASYSGTGDLFTSVLSAGLVRGEAIVEVVKRAMRFLEPALEATAKAGTDRNEGVHFEPYLPYLFDGVCPI